MSIVGSVATGVVTGAGSGSQEGGGARALVTVMI